MQYPTQRLTSQLQALALFAMLLCGPVGAAPVQALPPVASATGPQAWVFDAAVYNKAQEDRARRLHQALTRQNTHDSCTHFSSSFAAAGLSGNLRAPAEVQAGTLYNPGDALKLMVNAFRHEVPPSEGFEINASMDLTPAGVVNAVANALDENRAVIIGIDSVALYEAFFQRPENKHLGIAHAVMVSGVNRSQNGVVRGFYFLDSAVGMSYFADVKLVEAALLTYRQLGGGTQPLFYLKSSHPQLQTLMGRFHNLRLVNLDQDWVEKDKLLCFQAHPGRLGGNLFQLGTSPQGSPRLLRQDYLSVPLESQNLRPLEQPWMLAGQKSAYCPELGLPESALSKFDVQGLVLSAGPFAETEFRVLKDASGTSCPADQVKRLNPDRRFEGQDRKQCSPMGNDSFQVDGQAFNKPDLNALPVFGRPAYCSDTSKTLLGWTVHAQTVGPNATDYGADRSAEASHFPLVPMRGYACIQADAMLKDGFLLGMGQFFPDFRKYMGNWKKETASWDYTRLGNPSPLEMPIYVRKESGDSPQRTEAQEATIAYAALRDLYEHGGSRVDYDDYRKKWAQALETYLKTKAVDIFRFRGHELLLLHLKHNRSVGAKPWGQVLVSPAEAELGIYYLARSAEGLLGSPQSRQDLTNLGIASDWSRPLYKGPVPGPQKKTP